jgi:hypothetical protein
VRDEGPLLEQIRRAISTNILHLPARVVVTYPDGTERSVFSELVSEREDFQVQRGARLDDKSERVEQRDDDGPHASRLSENARDLNHRKAYGVFSSNRHSSNGSVIGSSIRAFDQNVIPGASENGALPKYWLEKITPVMSHDRIDANRIDFARDPAVIDRGNMWVASS